MRKLATLTTVALAAASASSAVPPLSSYKDPAQNTSAKVAFRLEAPMQIIYSNNPEQIHDVDMCDYQPAPKALLEVHVQAGSYRNFWEYLNADFEKAQLGWAIIGTNTDNKDV